MPAYEIQPGVALGAQVEAYERGPDDPLTRPLRIYTLDPSLMLKDGAVATINVPYEPLAPGPVGMLLEVECADGEMLFAPLDLESPRILIANGLAPSVGNPAFHQQMVYAVASSVYQTFRVALGRLIAWGFDDPPSAPAGPRRLKLRPHVASEGANAGYDKSRGEIRFGHYRCDDTVKGLNLPGACIFTCLSHDIISHEMTHALIDGLRSRFTIPTNPDVLGFHEGLSDLVAVFHHFLYPDVLAAQIRVVGPDVEKSGLLMRIAANFGLTATDGETLRIAVDAVRYDPTLPAHRMGTVLVTAVFEAYLKVFKRKSARYLRMAGPQPAGFWNEDLVQALAKQASQLARNFLDICIRALDYCPPVDLELGEYLRAVITADRNLVPDDPWGYRETLIECFANRGIYPGGVAHLSEDSLLWRAPRRQLPLIPELSFGRLQFKGDPSVPASAAELERQAAALGDFITQPQYRDEFGLMAPDGADVDLPAIQSIRTTRRVGPDGNVLFDLVAEVTQRRVVEDAEAGVKAKFFGGSTIIIGPKGEIRYVISKNIGKQWRIDRQLAFQKTSDLWGNKDGRYAMWDDGLKLVHKGLARG